MFRLSAATGVPVKKLMMPLSIVAILGGCLTLIGTSTNLIVDGLAQEAGMLPFSIFEITPYGIVLSLVGCAALLILGPFLLPSDPPREAPGQTDDTSEYLTELSIRPDSAAVGKPLKSVGSLKRSEEHTSELQSLM